MKKGLLAVVFVFCCAGAFAENKFTIKGALLPDANLATHASASGSKLLLNYGYAASIALGAEYEAYAVNDYWDLNVGCKYNPRMAFSKVGGELTVDGETTDMSTVDVIATQMSHVALYGTSRWFLDKKQVLFAPYAAVRLSLNQLSATGKDAGALKMNPGIGYGLSFGAIVADTFDGALDIDVINGSMTLDSLKNGSYQLVQIALVGGIRF